MNIPTPSTSVAFAEPAGECRRAPGARVGGAQLCQNPRLRPDPATASPR